MGAERWVLGACLVVLAACGKTSSNDGAQNSASDSAGAGGLGTSGSAGGQANGATATTHGVTTGGPVCVVPGERDCEGQCVDPRTSFEHCGSCGNVCADGFECVFSRCAPRLTCDRAPSHFDAAEMDPSGGVAQRDGWLLAAGESLSLEHTFTNGWAVLVLRARGVDGQPRPHVSVTIGESSLGPLLLRATSHATYSLEYDGLAGAQTVSITPTPESGSEQASVVVESLTIQDCWSLYHQCERGGYYLSEIAACAPPVCSEPSDCSLDLPGPAFLGSCDNGSCRFPSCTDLAASGVPLYQELASAEISVQCFSYAELSDPLRNPRATSLAGDPQNFECPGIDELTWQVDPFRGETTCVQGPVCGPNKPEELSFEPNDDECCYMTAWLCGV